MDRKESYAWRVVTKKGELDAKLATLVSFLESEEFSILDEKDQELLIEQKAIMVDCSQTLGQRIERFV